MAQMAAGETCQGLSHGETLNLKYDLAPFLISHLARVIFETPDLAAFSAQHDPHFRPAPT